ncbi:hypothetical protein CBS115989_10854 [Aspergillus niger]|uniref:Ankyrin repeat family protein n=1 Tax=Aspergillus niger TaxID=5061 RepID=A0A254TNV3_ASPNG|nr:hypothetical protein CBS115989_10854 [Aspergillus niger]KAI2831424.1 hypothetical protein CBS133816_2644 [Aspergillus niger]KAI2834422.1 hypothetical protein CBS11232_10823 [Aspergillus niger]KAI2841359.1 hypothetical protein CBS11350_6527 [Aspergillus niger]KAI2865390.1 hypothetical protein CBS12448_2020 [Aspergillus niger]
MTVNATVLYPKDAAFDLQYYFSNHMTLAVERWSLHGLKDWRVVQFTSSDAPFVVGAMFTWDSMNGLTEACKAEDSKAIFEDVPNFSDQEPIILYGDVVETWQRSI